MRLLAASLACVFAVIIPTRSQAGEESQPQVMLSLEDLAATVGNPILEPGGLYVPIQLGVSRPVPVLLALHGYSSSGEAIAGRLRTCADQYGWLLVAPSMAYRDYFDPDQLRLDAQENLPAVHVILDKVRAAVSGFVVQPRLIVYGFSRGAQMAERFALLYPHEVAAVAALSAGSYTLPTSEDFQHHPLRFPFGVADLNQIGGAQFDWIAFSQIPFWVGVGAEDANPADTSRPWDTYEGRTRVDRARTLVGGLPSAQLHIFSAAGHEETASMRASACAFLNAQAEFESGPPFD
jgi:pimeloyl-ACP methyl ester carboxylesterase